MLRKIFLLLLVLVFSLGLSAQSPTTYFVSDFSTEEFDRMLELCEEAGVEGLLQRTPFSSYGHYQWNPDFAPEGDRSVARMVRRAKEQGVQLGIFAQSDAISLNDAYFSPRYYHRLKRVGKVELFDRIEADEREFALRPNELFSQPSTLNLLLVDGELISYGTKEPAQEAVLLYRCTRGAFGTTAADHSVRAEAYKLWDSPERFVAPDASLRDSVQWHLSQRIEAGGLRFVRYPDEPGMNKVDGTVRVRQLDAWEAEFGTTSGDGVSTLRNGVTATGSDLTAVPQRSLGWFNIHASDGRQPATTVEELEWVLSKAAAFDAGYGLVIDRDAVKRHGQLDRMMALVKAWNTVRDAGILTESQKEDLLDPYADWHLEACGEDGFLLYPVRISRRYRCPVTKGPIQETWRWKASEKSPVSLFIEVKGKGEIRQPAIAIGTDTLRFPCAVKAGQLLHCGFNGKVRIIETDHHQTIKELTLEELSMLPEGETEVTFTYETRADGKLPEVLVRYQTRETPIPLVVPTSPQMPPKEQDNPSD